MQYVVDTVYHCGSSNGNSLVKVNTAGLLGAAVTIVAAVMKAAFPSEAPAIVVDIEVDIVVILAAAKKLFLHSLHSESIAAAVKMVVVISVLVMSH